MAAPTPMLAAKGERVPAGPEWWHEVKWDGVRILADVRDGRTRLYTRNGNDATLAWPDVSESPAGERDLLVDGEIIALNDEGLPDFRVVAERMHVRSATTARRLAQRISATFMVFDLLRLDGEDFTALPLTQRRARLEELVLGGSWQVPAVYDDGEMLFDATLQQGLEGIVSKRRTSRYTLAARTKDWQKFAHRHRFSFVVGGWRPQEGTSDRLAAVLVGEPTPQGLHFRGRVGSGIGGAASRQLTELLAGTERDDSPFASEVPRADAIGTRWVEPIVVVDVDTLGRAPGVRLRQPSFRGVRADLTPGDPMTQSR